MRASSRRDNSSAVARQVVSVEDANAACALSSSAPGADNVCAATIVAAGASFWMLAAAMRHLPVGTAYAVWTGIGAVGAAIAGMLILKEPATLARIASLALVVIGIAGLRATNSE